MMMVLVGHGQNAAMCQVAVGALKLNGSVVYMMAVGEQVAHLVENGVAGRRWNVGNGDMR